MSEKKPGLAILPGFPADVVAVSAIGSVSQDDYRNVLVPCVEARIKAQGKIKLIYVLGAEFGGFSPGAAWEDARLGLSHWSAFRRVAVVTDTDWIRLAIRMFAPLIPCPTRIFALSAMPEAKAWIGSNEPTEDEGPGIDSTRRLPTLEDMGPPEL